jgi:hypothetical protein
LVHLIKLKKKLAIKSCYLIIILVGVEWIFNWLFCTTISTPTTIFVHAYVNQITQTTLNGASYPNQKIYPLATNRNISPKTCNEIHTIMCTNKTCIIHKKTCKKKHYVF